MARRKNRWRRKLRIFLVIVLGVIVLAGYQEGTKLGKLHKPAVIQPATTSEASWIAAFLKSAGAPDTPIEADSIATWIAREKPPGDWDQWNNPLNTCWTEPGSTENPAGAACVQEYLTEYDGLLATVDTIEGYPDLLAALRAGNGLCGYHAGFSKWSGGGYSQIC